MQIGQQRGHLLFVEPAVERRHHSFACEYNMPYIGVSCGRAAGKGGLLEDAAQVRWNFLESQIIVPMAMGAANFVEMLPFCLLRCKRLGAATGCEGESGAG